MNKFEIVKDEFRAYPDTNIKLPVRATKHSAGYDICTPIDITIPSGACVKVKTDIKAKIKDDEVLLIFVRSSVGIKRKVALMTGTSVIDADFYDSDCGGNISVALWNYGNELQTFKAGDRICHGVFVKYDTVEDDNAETIRIGGIGSTN